MTIVIGILGVVLALGLVGVLLRMIQRSRITDFDIDLARLTESFDSIAMAFGNLLLPPLKQAIEAFAAFGQAMADAFTEQTDV